jgi:serine/threonine protein kinase
LADEVRDAISVMEKVLNLAGTPSEPLPEDATATRDENPLNSGDTKPIAESQIKATVDSQEDAASFAVTKLIKLAAGEAFGRYQIVNLLGEGAMGAVYLAYDPPLQRHVAIKIPIVQNSTVLERFYVEARATATLRSPNICPVYDVGQISGSHYISMAFIDGRPLSKVLAEGPMSLEQTATILRKIASGIQKAHERGIVHRDLKPDNIMIDMDGEPVVMDFGLAVRTDDEDARITKDGAVVGSPAYMSPEQAEGKQHLIGPSTDIYSLGVVLYEMLARRLPFEGSIMHVLKQVISDPPTPPSKYNEEVSGSLLEQLCLKMLEKSPGDRVPCMSEVAEAADECIRVELAQRSQRGKRRRLFSWPFAKS